MKSAGFYVVVVLLTILTLELVSYLSGGRLFGDSPPFDPFALLLEFGGFVGFASVYAWLLSKIWKRRSER